MKCISRSAHFFFVYLSEVKWRCKYKIRRFTYLALCCIDEACFDTKLVIFQECAANKPFVIGMGKDAE